LNEARRTVDGPGEQQVGLLFSDAPSDVLDTLVDRDRAIERHDQKATLDASIHATMERR
jgi:hypothetical protein